MNYLYLPSGEPGRLGIFTPTRAREGVPRVPEAGPNMLKFIGFCQATPLGSRRRSGAPLQRRGAAQLGSLPSYNILPKRDRLDRGL